MSTKITASVSILLVRPLYPGNVGSVARVMKNLGFRKLGIVSDQDPRKEPEALRMAHGAEDVLERPNNLTLRLLWRRRGVWDIDRNVGRLKRRQKLERQPLQRERAQDQHPDDEADEGEPEYF